MSFFRSAQNYGPADKEASEDQRKRSAVIDEVERIVRERLKNEYEALERARVEFAVVKEAARFAIAALRDLGKKSLAEEYELKLRVILSP